MNPALNTERDVALRSAGRRCQQTRVALARIDRFFVSGWLAAKRLFSRPRIDQQLEAPNGGSGLALRQTEKWIVGKRLVCPDTNRAVHKRVLAIS